MRNDRGGFGNDFVQIFPQTHRRELCTPPCTLPAVKKISLEIRPTGRVILSPGVLYGSLFQRSDSPSPVGPIEGGESGQHIPSVERRSEESRSLDHKDKTRG